MNKFVKKDGPSRKFQKAKIELSGLDFLSQKMAGDDVPDGYIAGWASTPDLDYYGDVIVSGAFDESISERGLRGPEGVKLLIQHDANKPAGVIEVLENRDGKLWMEAQLDTEISYVRDYHRAAKINGGMNFSVGFYIEEAEYDDDGDFFKISKGDLIEVSLVTFPGNRRAHMTEIKSAPDEDLKFTTLSAFEKALVADQLVESRNAANAITRMIKRNGHLFAPAPAADVQGSHDESLGKIRQSIGGLRNALKPKEKQS